MVRLEKVYNNEKYQSLLHTLKQLETDRIYCKHNEEHFLAVARIAYIKCLEQSIPVSKELLYCAAFLHDIGKADQYTKQIPHEIASTKYAEEILQEEGFNEDEIFFVLRLVKEHRKGPNLHTDCQMDMKQCNVQSEAVEDAGALSTTDRISDIFYQADKESRNCFSCKAADSCNWPLTKRNLLNKL